jgi:hypothetical protein
MIERTGNGGRIRPARLKAIARRMAPSIGVVVILAGVALLVGTSGYHWIGGLSWVDSLLNASMILGGMGPVDPLHTAAAKIFASMYALFSGLIFIAVMGIILAPITHIVLHQFHVDERDVFKKTPAEGPHAGGGEAT